jgi:hypothetical protein
VINSITPFVAVRNLRRRPDRLTHMQEQLNRLEIKYYVFDCADDVGTEASATWWNAHNALQLIRYAKKIGLSSFLTLDDDCLFIDNFNDRLASLWPFVPDNWDIVSFGEIYGQKSEIYPGIVKTTHSWGGHASLIKHTVYDSLLENITGNTWADEEINHKMKEKINYYAFSPYLITQMPGHSDLKNYYVNNDNFQ